MQSSGGTHRLAGATLKLQRAHFHHETLHAAIQRARKSYPNAPLGLIQELDAQERQMSFVVKFDPPPTRWAPLIGDILHNLRSALDHLMWELARLRNFGHEPPEWTRATFPIFPNRGRFWRKGRDGRWTSASGASALQRVPGDARRLILEVQPYKDGGRAKEHPLWLLHRLANADKHKTLHHVTQALVTGGYDVIEQRNVRLGDFEAASGILRPGPRVIGTLGFTQLAPDAHLHVQPQFGFAETFVEGGPAAGKPISETVVQILEYVVNEVFSERFWPYFGVEPSGEIRAITDHSQPD